MADSIWCFHLNLSWEWKESDHPSNETRVVTLHCIGLYVHLGFPIAVWQPTVMCGEQAVDDMGTIARFVFRAMANRQPADTNCN